MLEVIALVHNYCNKNKSLKHADSPLWLNPWDVELRGRCYELHLACPPSTQSSLSLTHTCICTVNDVCLEHDWGCLRFFWQDPCAGHLSGEQDCDLPSGSENTPFNPALLLFSSPLSPPFPSPLPSLCYILAFPLFSFYVTNSSSSKYFPQGFHDPPSWTFPL